MQKVVKSRTRRLSYTDDRINRFAKALGNAVQVYYQLDQYTQSEIDNIIGSDMIVDIEDCIKALSIR